MSVLNIGLWLLVACLADLAAPYRAAHLALAGVYTFVCAFRSFFPRVDLERTVLVDHPLSNIVLGRSAATVAEMCFTAQLSLLLFEFSPQVPWVSAIGVVILPLIAVAQLTCWAGVLTGNHLWHAAEESLWAAMVLLLAVAGVGLWPGADATLRIGLGASLVACAGAVFVMAGLDVPMYVRRYREEVRTGASFMTFSAGLRDALARREPTGAWSVWRHEVAWMTPYFSLGVWMSQFMVLYAP